MMTSDSLTHLDETGQIHMVDVGHKNMTLRVAQASATVIMQKNTMTLIRSGHNHKGDVMATARLAGLMAAKKTADLIPLCHSLALSSVNIDFIWPSDDNILKEDVTVKLKIHSTCQVIAQTGVEMEALTAVSIAALTIYDMCKAVDRSMVITNIHLLRKEGGKSGLYVATDRLTSKE
jgi:cyclic pyranopterin phosphate synthase